MGSITLDVVLLSGRAVSIECSPTDSLEYIRRRVQHKLGVGKGRLLRAPGEVMDTLDGLRNKEVLTYQVNLPVIQSTDTAFAAILGDGTVCSWSDTGDDSFESLIGLPLRNVVAIQSNVAAFAALVSDGTVVR